LAAAPRPQNISGVKTPPSLGWSFDAVFDDMREGVQIIGFDFRYIYLNSAAATHGRRSASDLVGRLITDEYPGIEATEMFTHLMRCLVQREAQQVSNLFTYPDGTQAWFDLRMNPVPMGVMILSIDITGEKAVAAALRESHEAMAAILHSMADGLIVTDIGRRVTIWNRAAETMTGWTEAEAKGRDLDELIAFAHQLSGEGAEHPVNKVLHSGTPIGMANDTFLVARSGRRIPIASSAAPLHDLQGALRGVVLVIKDMSEQYTLREGMRQLQKLEAVARVAGGVAHDFNNLLTVISGCCQLGLDEGAGEGALREDLLEISRAAERGRLLTRQLLTFSRSQPVQPTPVNVNEAVAGCHSMLSKVIGEHIHFDLELADNLPDVLMDPTQLDQVIMNLAVNARDAMPEGGRLMIRTMRAGSDVNLIVTDTGIGMDAATLEKIYEPFFTTKGPGEGTGLGLPTTYRIITQSGGTIGVTSKPGQGTTFTIRIPGAR
jgi:PAS domain S-box-containing protein